MENRITGTDFFSILYAVSFPQQKLANGLAVGTVNKDIRTLRSIFNLAIDPRGYLKDGQNPFARIRQRKRASKPLRYVTVNEYGLLLDSTDRLWWKAVISVAYGSGLRKNEILNLTWADIDFENEMILIRSKESTNQTVEWEPKDHENREVPMSAQTSQLLADIQVEAAGGSPYLFITPERLRRIFQRVKQNRWNSKSEMVNNVLTNFKRLCRRAGVSKCTLHDLRRSAITNWARHLPIQVVQQLAGHSNIATTRKYYLSVPAEDMERAGQVVNAILSDAKK